MQKKYDGIDLMKFIASIFVVAIHTGPFADINPMLNTIVCEGIARLGVPLFFLASAFLFYSGGNREGKVVKYLKRMGIRYLCWFLIMLPITIYDRFIVSTYSLPITIIRFIRSFFVTSTFSGSWFLVSCAFCVILFAFIDKLDKKTGHILTIILSSCSYLICVFTSAYGALIERIGLSDVYNLYEMIFANPYTSFLVGIPYFAVARYLVNNDLKIKHIKPLAAISVVLLVLEVVLTLRFNLHKTTDCYFMLLPCAAMLFSLIKNATINIKSASTMRKMSTIIFFSHFIWLFALRVIGAVLNIELMNIMVFLITLILSLLTAKVIMLSNQGKFKWLRYLY